MKYIVPNWFFKFFVFPYLLLIVVLVNAFHIKETGNHISKQEEDEVYDRFYYPCIALGVLTAAVTFFVISQILKTIVL